MYVAVPKIGWHQRLGMRYKASMAFALRPLHHLAVKVVELDRCEAFYHGKLGLPVLRRQHDANGAPRSTWLDLGYGAILMLEHTAITRHEPTGWHMVALRISHTERAAVEAHLASQGIAVTDRTDYTLYIEDPEGNRLGFSHWPDKAISP